MISRILDRTALLGALIFGMAMAAAEEPQLTIGLIGDSTVATTYGWGPAFAGRLDGAAEVLNFAKNGATLPSLSGQLDLLLEENPDYVIIQFGHNDQKKYGTDIYAENLRSYVSRIKSAGSKAIIFSSVTRRNFGEDGKIELREEGVKKNLTFYSKAAQSVAEDEGVPFVDLHAVSIAHHNKIGAEVSAAYDFEEGDRTHFSREGAEAIATLILADPPT